MPFAQAKYQIDLNASGSAVKVSGNMVLSDTIYGTSAVLAQDED